MLMLESIFSVFLVFCDYHRTHVSGLSRRRQGGMKFGASVMCPILFVLPDIY